jgi:hypothetical protein
MIQSGFHLGYLTSLFIASPTPPRISTVLAESVPPHYLGVAYAVRSVIGFGAGVVSPFVFGWARCSVRSPPGSCTACDEAILGSLRAQP